MSRVAPGPFATKLKAFRAAAGYTQEELATIAGLSVQAVSALERGERRRPHVETVRALSAALDLTGTARDALVASARAPAHQAAVDELGSMPLPLPLTDLLGRERDLETLRQWLADPGVRLITLVGPGGVGKTRLAIEIARAIDGEGERRVVFVPLAAVQDSAFVAPTIADALGVGRAAPLDLPKSLRIALGHRQLLLVLDNCEHLLDAAPLVADLLAASGSIRVLATSRAPLRLRGERRYAVTPLAMELDSEVTSVADRARVPAVRLFIERVRDIDSQFRLTATNGPTVSAICQRLDALPLALELAAPWVKVLPLQDLLNRLEHDALLATIGPRDLPSRQQTLNTTVGWSYRLLDPLEQRAFRRLGAIRGRFSIEAAASVLADPPHPVHIDDALTVTARLIDKSLLQRTESTWLDRPLYQMFETVRAYAWMELAAAGERDRAIEGLARHCGEEVRRSAAEIGGPAQNQWLNRIRDELENYRSAMAWLLERHQHARACDIAWGLGLFFLVRGHTTEGLHWYKQILVAPSLSPLAEAQARVGAGLMYWARGEFDLARSNLERSLAMARDLGATELIVHAESILGHVDHAMGNLDAARERYSRTLEGYRGLGMLWGIGNALSGLGGVALTAGNRGEARRLLDEATSVLRQAGPWFLTPVLCFRAVLALHAGEVDEVMVLMHESLTHIRALQDRFAFVYALVPLAMAAVLTGNHAWAARLLGARDAVAESTGAVIVDRAVQPVRERAEQEARAHLGRERWARAYAAGRTASMDSLLKDLREARQR